jgi:hypothetical protein
VGWKDDSIHHPFVRRGEAYFCDEKMKIAGSDRKYVSTYDRKTLHLHLEHEAREEKMCLYSISQKFPKYSHMLV